MNFCVIDDEREVCDVFRLFFESRGHRCRAAYDGKDGLTLVRGSIPDAVFLDVQMPNMNGYEVLAQLKSDPATKDIPVLLMTALVQNSNRTDAEWAKSTGADAFLTKPFELEDLLTTVEKMTGVKV